MSSAIKISVRELHARTGHYIRKAAVRQRVIVTDNGHAIAEVVALAPTTSTPFFSRRVLQSAFQKMREQGKFRPRSQDRDITDVISGDRD
jgi:antitoxin (DNA-binding transcriptional repressor) of toxin-antitoxin stability system